MDQKRIAEAIEKLLSSRAEPLVLAKIGAPRPDALSALARGQFGAALQPLLASEPEFANERRYWCYSFGFTERFDVAVAAHYVARACEQMPPAGAVAALCRLLSTKRATGTCFSSLYGPSVQSPIELTPTLSIVPFDSVPDSAQKRRCHPVLEDLLPRVPLLRHAPTSVLAYSFAIDPVIGESDSLIPRDFSAQLQHIHDARTALNAAGRGVVFSGLEWTHFDDPDVNLAMSDSIRWTMHEIVPFMIHGLPLDATAAKAVVRGLLEFAESDKPRVIQAIDRLRNHRVRRQLHDKALELGISYETILCDPDEWPGELTYRLSLRAARFMGESAKERANIRTMVRRLYAARSAAAHGATVSDPKGTDQLLVEADEFLTKMIQRMLESRAIPRWTGFDIA